MGKRFSLREPTILQEQNGKKRRRLAAVEMMVGESSGWTEEGTMNRAPTRGGSAKA